ncbi:MAG TPA: alpha/beta hydrolase [Coriobacteriia bacterium]
MLERTICADDGMRLWAADHDERTGSERLPVLFIHGFGGSSSATGHMAAHVNATGRRFVAPDLRGHGLSEKPSSEGAYTLARFVADVSAVARELRMERFHLAGHCMGGMVAAAYAIEHPETVASLSLIGTSLRPGAERPFFARVSAVVQAPVMPMARRAFPAGSDAPPHVDYSRFRNMGDIYWRRMVADWRALTADTGEVITRTIRSIDLIEAATAIAAPTLVVHGAHDRIFPPAAARRTHGAIVGSVLSILPNDNHVTLVLDPASALFDEFASFADRAEAG